MSLILGVHVSQKSHVLDDKTPSELSLAISRDLDTFGLNACQIFTYGPRILIKNKLDVDKIKSTTTDINLTVHSAYPTTSIWKNLTARKLTLFEQQIRSCRDINAWGLVLHINKIKPEVIASTMAEILPIAKSVGVCILLEMTASKADPELTYETPQKLDRMCEAIERKTDHLLHQWYGITIDTAHLWGAGIDISSYNNMKNFFDEMKRTDKIMQFHLNGSSANRYSGKDKHEIPFSKNDLIWKDIDPKEAGVRAIVEFAFSKSIAIICEINRGAQKDVENSMYTIKKYVL
jgi:endonuclease IV